MKVDETNVDEIGEMLETKGMSDSEIDAWFEHSGVKGMQWGVRRKVSGHERREGRKDLKDTAKTARQILKSANKAKTPELRKIAADRYKKEVFDHIKSDAFRKSYQNANTMGKGEKAVHLAFLGPIGLLTISSVKKQYAMKQSLGPDSEIGIAKAVLKQINEG